MPYSWSQYNHDCGSCYNNYNLNPRQGPCYLHRDDPGNKELDDTNLGSTYVWSENDEPFDFQSGSIVHNRLSFLKFVWDGKPQGEH